MWLINVDTLQLEDHHEPSVPYAVLSHTWGREEVSFHEFRNLDDSVRRKAGFPKIVDTCRLAKSLGLSHAWVDTCCIDKSSSAELSEAINSMFRWYRRSSACFAYLADLHNTVDSSTFLENLGRCRWFTWGWTLQELIALRKVTFYNAFWKLLGTKHSLADPLAFITRIETSVLSGKVDLSEIPVATRMSWASRRRTTRIEDTAYCLLGIFDINMPLLYGEGRKAFARLQSEILQETNDLSLLAWLSETADPDLRQEYSGVFADSPSDFSACSRLRIVNTPQFFHNAEVVVTRSHISTKATMYMREHSTEKDYVLPLQCSDDHRGSWYASLISINITMTPDGFVRHMPWRLNVGNSGLETGRRSKPVPIQPFSQRAMSLKLRRHMTLRESDNLEERRFDRAIFVRFSEGQVNLKWRLNSTFLAMPDAHWDELNRVFLDKGDAEVPLSPRILQFSLRPLDSPAEDATFLLVSFSIFNKPKKGPERWADVASYHEEEDSIEEFIGEFGQRDASSIMWNDMMAGLHSELVETGLRNGAMDFGIPDEAATLRRPGTSTLKISRDESVRVTVRILPSDAGREACEVWISLEDAIKAPSSHKGWFWSRSKLRT